MTPGELNAIIKACVDRESERMKFRDMLNGVLCSLLANVNRGSDTDPFKADDFMIMRDKPSDAIQEHPEEVPKKLKLLAAAGIVREVR